MHEYQPDFGASLVCGVARLFGWKIGVLANNGVLFNDSALKAAHFMQLCDRDEIPLLFLQNITGFMIGREYESRGITKDGAKMIMTQVGVRVPKLTVVVNASFGAGNYGMCGRAFDPRMLFSWPNAQTAVMGAEQAANTLTELKRRQIANGDSPEDREAIERMQRTIAQDYEAHSDAYWSTSEIWDDGILDPLDTRNALAVALEAAMRRPLDGRLSGVLRL
jgi:3-methylcrotonyl-CoA carboxylase beta subunit